MHLTTPAHAVRTTWDNMFSPLNVFAGLTAVENTLHLTHPHGCLEEAWSQNTQNAQGKQTVTRTCFLQGPHVKEGSPGPGAMAGKWALLS